jgi:DNA-binding PadR family transcriptional regulator
MVSKIVNSDARVILKALDSYWYILEQLSQGKKYVAELAELTRRKPPQISKDLKSLRKEGFVESVEEGGRKYFDLTVKGRKIFEGVSQAIQPTGDAVNGRIDLDWKVTALLETLEDNALSEELRMSCSKSLLTLIQRYPAEMLGQDRVKGLVKRTVDTLVANPSLDRITDELRRSVKELLCYAMGKEKEASWVTKELYPNLKELMMRENAGDIHREWAARCIGEIARRHPILATRKTAKCELLATWFHHDVKPEGALGKALVDEIISTASREVFIQIREKAKGTDPRTIAKAEILLKEFINQLNQLSRRA